MTRIESVILEAPDLAAAEDFCPVAFSLATDCGFASRQSPDQSGIEKCRSVIRQ